MDKESYRKIKALISSNDPTNVALGVELMKSLKGPLLYPFMQKLARRDEFLLLAINAELEEGLKKMEVQQIRMIGKSNESPSMNLGKSIGALTSLEIIQLQNLNIQTLPNSLGNLKKIRELTLDDNNIEQLPESIVDLRELKILNLSRNPIKKLPEDFGKLKKLKELNLSSSALKTLPSSIADCERLGFLNLGNASNLSELPDELFASFQLTSLYLGGTAITQLPKQIQLVKRTDFAYITLQLLNSPLKSLKPILDMDTQGNKGVMNIYKGACPIPEAEIRAIERKFSGEFVVTIHD